MKISWSTVAEIFIGVFVAGMMVAVLHGLFAKFLAAHGAKITGVADSSAVPAK